MAHHGGLYSACSGRIVELPFGRALFQDRAPLCYDHNVVRVERASADLTAEALAATTVRLQATLGYARIEIWDEPTAERLLPPLEAAGWQADPILLMDHRGTAPHPAATVEPADPAELEPLRAEWLRAAVPPAEPIEAIVADVHRADAIMREHVAWRAYCVREGVRPVAMAWLLGEDGGTAMVEDVYVTPSHRGRGLGAAVVGAAVAAGRAAGAGLVYLPTDAGGLARLFYRRLGFRELAVITRLLKRP